MNDNNWNQSDGDGSTALGFIGLVILSMILAALGPWICALLDFASW